MFRKCLFAACLFSTILSVSPLFAHGSAVGIVRERMKVMEYIAQHTRQIAPFAMGTFEMNTKFIKESGRSISLAAEKLLQQFPEGSLSESSEAKANIWENWEEFSGLLKKLQKDAADLSEIAKNDQADDIAPQFAKMTSSCKTCHTKFRQKKAEELD